MDNKHSNGVKPDSMKRKRAILAEDATPDPKRNSSCKKSNAAKTKILDSPNMATTELTGETAQVIAHHSNLTTINSGDAGSGPISSDTNTASDDKTNNPDDIPSKPTLQTLPRELRDLIYDFVAATEERIVLGIRMLDTRRENSTWALDERFDEAVALHPLSMTCHQFRDEFQDLHHSAGEPTWVLLVNNFDLEQLQIFSDYIQSAEFIHVLHPDDAYGLPEDVPVYNVDVSLRFQMDGSALESASKLCQHVYFGEGHRGAAPQSLTDRDAEVKWLGAAEIVTHYVPRTTTAAGPRIRSMRFEIAEKIKLVLNTLRDKIMNMPNFDFRGLDGPFGRELRGLTVSFVYMEQCWFHPFYEAFERMRVEKAERGREDIRRAMHRIVCGETCSHGGFKYAD